MPERMVFPEILGKDFVDEIVGVIFVHLDFFHDHATFARNVIGVEDRIEDEVAEDVESGRYVLVKYLDVEADAFLGGECVHVAAEWNPPGGQFLRPCGASFP